MAITVGKLPASAAGSTSYTTSGNNITLTYTPSGNYVLDYWKVKNNGYQLLDYIESDGTAFLDLGVYPDNDQSYIDTKCKNVEIDMDCMLIGAPTQNVYMYGVESGYLNAGGVKVKTSCVYLLLRNSTARLETRIHTSSTNGGPCDLTPNVKHHIHHFASSQRSHYWEIVDVDYSLRDSRTIWNGGCSQETANCWNSFKNFYLFTAQDGFNNVGYTNGTKMRVYNFTLKLSPSNNGKNKVLNLLPAKRLSDNALGMYDVNSGKFFANARGSGAFTGGAVKSSFIEGKIYKSNPATTYYASAYNFEAYACVYDTTKSSGYIEIEGGSTAETSNMCLIKQNLQRAIQLDLDSQFILKGTTNGGVSWQVYGIQNEATPISSKAHVFYAEQDGFIVSSERVQPGTPGPTKFAIWVNGEIRELHVMKATEISVSNVYPFKKGDLIVYAGASNYTSFHAAALVFYI